MKLERTKDRIIFPIKVQPMEATFPNTITLLLSKKKQRSKNEHKHPSFLEAKNTKKEIWTFRKLMNLLDLEKTVI
jgi:hypothetical protein